MNARSVAFTCLAVMALIAGSVAPAVATTPPITPGHAPYPPGGTNAIGAGVDSAAQNAQLAESLPSHVYLSWSAQPPLCAGAANSEARSISIEGSRTVVVDRQYQCSFVSAYNTSTGGLLWRRSYHFAGTAQVVGSSVFVAHDNQATGGTYVDALSLSSGGLLWSRPDADPTNQMTLAVGSGLVATPGWILNAVTGAHTLTSINAGGGSAVISNGRIYVNGSAVRAYTSGGQLLWTAAKSSGYGSGNARPSLHNGVLYVTSTRVSGPTSGARTLAIDARTGKVIRTLPPSAAPIAFDGNVGIFTAAAFNDSTTVSAVNLTTGSTYWSVKLAPFASGPATLWGGAPVVENGLVWLVASSDTVTPSRLIALDEVTGATRDTISQPCYPAQGSLVIAQHRIFSPSDCGDLTFTTSKTPDLLSDPGFESGTSGWSSFPGGTLSRVSSPVHSGSHAAKITPSTASQYQAGIRQNALVTNAVGGKLYTLSCWVRLSAAGPYLRAQIEDFSHDLSVGYLQPATVIARPVAGAWIQITASARALHNGDRMIPEVFAGGGGANTTVLYFDDCAVLAP